MLEIKTELISDGEDDQDEEEEEEEEMEIETSSLLTSSNVSFIIAHGPNGFISIPTHAPKR